MNRLVSLKYVDSYDYETIENELMKQFDEQGLFLKLKPKMKVMLKVCLNPSMAPDCAETTHPNIVCAIANILTKFGASCELVDSQTGKKYSIEGLDETYITTGMLEVANLSKCTLNHNMKAIELETPYGRMRKNLILLEEIKNVDAIINVGKIKIDDSFGYIGATANLFGFVPGKVKDLYINQCNNLGEFNEFLLDIYDVIKDKIAINVLDGIVALEANKTQRMLSCLASSMDIFALDQAIIEILNINKEKTIISNAKNRGYDCLSKIKVFGDEYEKFKVEDFALVDFDNNKKIVDDKKRKKFFNLNQKRVEINALKCKGCSICSKICPVGAILMKYDKNEELYAEIDYSKCVYCMKCQTACPYLVTKMNIPIGYKKIMRDISKFDTQQEN
ncbi:MAG: DUF362 domain-containing protein [Candidatus Onthoplasma sp.]